MVRVAKGIVRKVSGVEIRWVGFGMRRVSAGEVERVREGRVFL